MRVTESFHVVLFCAQVIPVLARGDVVINEIHYETADITEQGEFVELHNPAATGVDISGWSFTDGIDYVIPDGTTIPAGGHLVVAENPTVMLSQYGVEAIGPYAGKFSNDGERIDLRDAVGALRDRVEYRVAFPWPLASAGRGSSMELLNPSIDNDLGGSWRASGLADGIPSSGRIFLVPRQSDGWSYRPGTSEASDPPAAWRLADFVEDETWLPGATSMGYGIADVTATALNDMKDSHSTVYLRRTFVIDGANNLPAALKVGLLVDDAAVVWLNGVEVTRLNVPDGELAFDATASRSRTRVWTEFLVPGASAILVPGENVLAIHAVNVSVGDRDLIIDAELLVPPPLESGSLGPPTPGAPNSVLTANPSPQIRQVEHAPRQPIAGEATVIRAKVSDPDGVATVTVLYQVVRAGEYVPAFLPLSRGELFTVQKGAELAPNPEFGDPENWSEVAMVDDGSCDDVGNDHVYRAILPAQPNRTLVRYRIVAADAGGQPPGTAGTAIRAPFGDDPSLNFAYFVYNGVPAYATTRQSVHPEGAGHEYGTDVMNSLPVYMLMTREQDLWECIAWDPTFQISKERENARRFFNWEGAFIYDGRVYDHVQFRLRGHNQRYQLRMKRSMRFRFHKGMHLRARDQEGKRYATRWRTLLTGKIFGPRNVGGFGVTETVNNALWNLVGVPAPSVHTIHFRVVDGPEEAPQGVDGQYDGDFWGMALAIEDYDVRFLEAHGLPKANLYKLKDGELDGNEQKRYQAANAMTEAEEYDNVVANLHHVQSEAWLATHVDYNQFNRYHTVVQAIRHYDHGVYPNRENRLAPADSPAIKNATWYFPPSAETALGKLWILPYDSDQSWGPNGAHQGWDLPSFAMIDPASDTDYEGGTSSKPGLYVRYRNFLREFGDLVWTEKALNPIIDHAAAAVTAFSPADRDRWKDHPVTGTIQSDFGALADRVEDMKVFAFVGGTHWPVTSRPTSSVRAGGRAVELDDRASVGGDATSIPDTPTVTYVGAAGFPVDALVFETTPFADPQGTATFGSLQWRLAEVDDPSSPAHDAGGKLLHEYSALWSSGELTVFASQVTIPPGIVLPGHAYRVRARMRDNTDRGSHWSAPLHFIATSPAGAGTGIIITEFLANATGNDDGKEWFELYNTTASDIDVDGWTIADNDIDSHVIDAGGPIIVSAGGYLVLGESTDPVVNGGVQVDYAYGDDITLGNISDEIILLRGGNVVHSVGYGNFVGGANPVNSIDLINPIGPASPIVTAIDESPVRGAALGMGLDYCDGPVDSWIDQYTRSTPADDAGSPGAHNDGIAVCVVDETPPEIVGVSVERRNTVVLVFDEPLDPGTAMDTSHYSIDAGIDSPTFASVEGRVTVRLEFFARLEPGLLYTLGVLDVADVSGNVMTSPEELEIIYDCQSTCSQGFDCDGNGIRDDCDIATGDLLDADGDGIPDMCKGEIFIRGDCNGDGEVAGTITDTVFLLGYLFGGTGKTPACLAACNANADAGLNIADAVYELIFNFRGGASPPAPFPGCGRGNLATDELLGCEGPVEICEEP